MSEFNIPKLNDFILYPYSIVDTGFLPDYVIQAGCLRLSSPDGYMKISSKLRSLKAVDIRPNVPFGTGGRKSLNTNNACFVYTEEMLF